MPDAVVPLERARYREAAGVLAQAFRDDPVVAAIFKSLAPESRTTILTRAFESDLRACGTGGCHLAAVQGERLTGAAIIHGPGADPLPATVQLGLLGKVLLGGLAAPRAYPAFGRWLRWLAAIAKKHPREPHFYLEFIGVDAPFQGKGLGSRMLERLAARADAERLGISLESGNPRNLSLYRRFGFRTTAEEEILAVPTWFMWRPPIG